MKDSSLRKAKLGLSSPWIAGQFVIWMLVFTISLIMALLFTYSSLESQFLSQITLVINSITLFIGGYTAGKKAQKKGWYYGGMQGLIYCLILILIAFLGFDMSIQSQALIFLLIAFSISAVGGIIGVNRSR
ncbi:TIGR04086 family membrane protein [Thermoflavimicrobium daqui]|jgi:putative membrane protein (TIGR04086 family)|uniref:TIGR04086 family membrane protein n=1 Tax=Thermoflavimicrobium daqui TaxID=2137476 RepID=A0A364K8J7_9BACL|nr:TIGR04086 family membrane protein [Thermoflavimicrobium daqui]RAL26619.1 TIGR04086 family membrane protein [Thermoflavimicrobium daqui]